jgi:hypothetical protein
LDPLIKSHLEPKVFQRHSDKTTFPAAIERKALIAFVRTPATTRAAAAIARKKTAPRASGIAYGAEITDKHHDNYSPSAGRASRAP